VVIDKLEKLIKIKMKVQLFNRYYQLSNHIEIKFNGSKNWNRLLNKQIERIKIILMLKKVNNFIYPKNKILL
jgi:hypothetical protein